MNAVKNILLFVPIYPADDIQNQSAYITHYFAKEWVSAGYNVKVCQYPSNFPQIVYGISKLIGPLVDSKILDHVRKYPLKEKFYELDGISVSRFPMKKVLPHGKYSHKEINKAVENTIAWCSQESFNPDIIIGHWVNPALDIMCDLKKRWNKPICLVMHDDGFNFESSHKKTWKEQLDTVDVIGYRSKAIKESFEKKWGHKDSWFYCYSGVPKSFLAKEIKKNYETVQSFTFIGSMIQRKYPIANLEALGNSNIPNWVLHYVGAGKELERVHSLYDKQYSSLGRLIDHGWLSREEVRGVLEETDVFAMISRNETFGLVYLEAMSNGCITVASRNGGFDGIIQDGVNGFLCEAGNSQELKEIFEKIYSLTKQERKRIAEEAIATARKMTDEKVAMDYIHDVERLISEKAGY